MARLLLLVFLMLAALTMAVLLVRTVGELAQSAGRSGSALVRRVDGGNSMQKVAFVALILLLVGLTSGLIGGL